MTTDVNKDCLFTSKTAEFWFDNLIDSIRNDQTLLKVGLASKEKEDLYSALIKGQYDEMIKFQRTQTTQYFISRILIDYLKEINSFADKKNLKLAFDHTDSKVLVWAEVADEKMEDDLILAQAKINSVYSGNGYHVSSTIVYKEDNLTIPNHYRILE